MDKKERTTKTKTQKTQRTTRKNFKRNTTQKQKNKHAQQKQNKTTMFPPSEAMPFKKICQPLNEPLIMTFMFYSYGFLAVK